MYYSSQELWNKKNKGRANLGYLLLFQTGLRTGELLALLWDNVDLDKRMVFIKDNLVTNMDFNTGKRTYTIGTPKTEQSTRAIGLNDLALHLFKEIKARNIQSSITSPYVICNKDGKFMTPASFRRYAERLCKYADLPIINSLLHSSRHYYSTQAQESGVSVNDVGKALGQTNIKTTALYTHLNEEIQAKKMQEYNFNNNLCPTAEYKNLKNNIISLNDYFSNMAK